MIRLAPLAILVAAGCNGGQAADPGPSPEKLAALSSDIAAVAEALDVPGYAWSLSVDGETVASDSRGETRDGAPFTLETELRFASVTKAISGIALVQLAEEGKLDLDDPVRQWVPGWEGPDTVTIRHIAAHVSEGEPGTTYVYSSGRFAVLGAVMEAASGQDLADYFCDHIQRPSGAACVDSPALGAHAGLISSTGDIARIFNALMDGRLVSPEGLESLMTATPLASGGQSPVSLGLFVEDDFGPVVLWSFGQDDPDHSGTRVILVPSSRAVFVLLANSNAVSDAYRLLGGDLRADPLAQAVLTALDVPSADTPALATLADLMTAVYQMDAPTALAAFDQIPASLAESPPPSLVFAASMLCSVEPSVAPAALAITDRAVLEHPLDRWSLLFAASTQESCGDPQRAATHYRTILSLENQNPDFLHRLFLAWSNGALARLTLDQDPEQALAYVDAGIATGVGGETGEELAALRQAILEQLETAD